jgi:hypothetical protein
METTTNRKNTMKGYRDKATISQINKHQQKPEKFYGGQPMTNREKKRMQERWLKNVRNEIPNKFWWDSLTIDEQVKVANLYKYFPITQVIMEYPGNVAYQRELKLTQIL